MDSLQEVKRCYKDRRPKSMRHTEETNLSRLFIAVRNGKAKQIQRGYKERGPSPRRGADLPGELIMVRVALLENIQLAFPA